MQPIKVIEDNKRFIFNLVIIAIFIFVAYNFIYKKQLKEMQSLKERVELEKKKGGLLSDIAKSEKDILSYKEFLSEKDTNLIMDNLSHLAKSAGISIVSIRPSTRQKISDYTKLPFDLTLEVPNYNSLGKFISEVESSADVYIVDSVTVTPASASAGLNVNLTVSNISFSD